ncbi:putative amidoligase enzyme-domain-containing protein [Parachaetomium inaequale]|uniref:Amidoligase enzyme-domain-containing protein n=1 Tax=Parachaetomium inaequale TaxID=2588326 RepID=A0AAN6SSK2_9PEZI|nr:putative amidoligase enzyme-domain-containing protein [Parachaetomium inaequale]
MATSSNLTKGFTFGVEIEIYLQPKKTKRVSDRLAENKWNTTSDLNKKRGALIKTAASFIVEAGLTAVVEVEELVDQYRQWQVKGDGSLYELKDKAGFMGVEIVSPIMNAADGAKGIWSDDLDVIFSALARVFDIEVNSACSMHVHMKPEAGWTAADVRSLFKATAVFDDAITKIMPASRKQTPWAKSSFRAITSSDPEEAKMVPELSAAERGLVKTFADMKASNTTWQHLFNHFDTTIQKTKDIDKLADKRGVSMNFIPINKDVCHTVEFRRPPGVKTAEAAKRWVGFALGFVSAALDPNSGWEQLWSPVPAKKDATVDNLQSFIGNGLERLANLTGRRNWKSVVDPKSFKTDPSNPLALKKYEPGVIQAKLLKAMKQLGSFEEKVATSVTNSSRSNSSAGGHGSRDNSPSRTTPPKKPSSNSATGTNIARSNSSDSGHSSRDNSPNRRAPQKKPSLSSATGTASTGKPTCAPGAAKATGSKPTSGGAATAIPVDSHKKKTGTGKK